MIIKSYEQLVPLVDEMGILPLFTGAVPRFSLWDYTCKSRWFTGNPETDPWSWRERAASEGEVAYGKFFNGKAGFVSLRLFPDFVNFRRNGKTFEELYLARQFPPETAVIMEQFLYGDEYVSYELKKVSGVKKQFDQRITLLQHRTFLVTCDFQQKRSKTGKNYGWPVAVLVPPESLFGRENTLSGFSVHPETSFDRILSECLSHFPKVPFETWKKFLTSPR